MARNRDRQKETIRELAKIRDLSVEDIADIENPIIERKSMWGWADEVPHEASKNMAS